MVLILLVEDEPNPASFFEPVGEAPISAEVPT